MAKNTDPSTILHSMDSITSSLTVLLMYENANEYAVELCNNIRENDERFIQLDKLILNLDFEEYYNLDPYSQYALLTLLAISHSVSRRDRWYKHIVNRHQPLCIQSEDLLSAVVDAYTSVLVLRHIESSKRDRSNFPIIFPSSLASKVSRMRILLTQEIGNPLQSSMPSAKKYISALDLAEKIDTFIDRVLLRNTDAIEQNIENSCEEYFRKNESQRSLANCLTSEIIDFGHEARLANKKQMRMDIDSTISTIF